MSEIKLDAEELEEAEQECSVKTEIADCRKCWGDELGDCENR